MNENFPEMVDLSSWLGPVKRSRAQTNLLNQADCEIVKLNEHQYLTVTTDSLAEEIAFGLYQDPYTMGWIAATASLSDLAACGATPIGLLLSAQWDRDFGRREKERCLRGFKEALAHSNTYLLGGDTGQSLSTVLTSTGLGQCSRAPLTRMTAKPGDLLCTFGETGMGPALGFGLLLQDPNTIKEKDYRPQAATRASQNLLGHATAAMDSSDGMMQTLATLTKLNQVSIELSWSKILIANKAKKFCLKHNLPQTSLLYGEHGDFQLIFTIPEKSLHAIAKTLPKVNIIGKISEFKSGSKFILENHRVEELDFEPTLNYKKSSLKELYKAFQATIEYCKAKKLP